MSIPTWNDLRYAFLLSQVPGASVYWTLNDLEYAYSENPPDPVPPVDPPDPLTTVDTVWLYGASIENGTSKVGDLTDYTPALSCYLSQKVGRPITVVNKGVSSQTMDQILSRFNSTDKTAAQTLGNKLLIMSMPMGNDISTLRPFPGGMPGFESDYADLMEAFQDSGAYILPSTATFRNYGGTSVNNEEAGSLPYNTEVVIPYIADLNPSMWNNDADAPYNNPYELFRNWYDVLLDDEVHPTQEGYRLLGRYWMDVAAARILGQWPETIERVANPVANPPAKVPLEFGLRCVGGSNNGTTASVFGFLDRAVYSSATGVVARSLSGPYVPNSITVDYFNISTGATTTSQNLLNTGNTSNTLLNDAFRGTTFPRESFTFGQFCTFKGLEPNQPFEMEIMAARYAATPGADYTQFSFDGTNVAGEVLGRYASGNDIQILTLEGTANSSGEVPLYYRAKPGGWTFGYINGVVIRPL